IYERAIGLLPGPEAVVGIVPGDGEIDFVEAAGFEEKLPWREQARGSDCGHVADCALVTQRSHVVGGILFPLEIVAGQSLVSHHDTKMLDPAVGIEQLGADRADALHAGEADHALQPIPRGAFWVVVWEER